MKYKFKKREHNLYSKQRHKEFVKSSLSLILQRLLDKDKQLFAAADMGNVKQICEAMVSNNSNEEIVSKIDEKSKHSILDSIQQVGDIQAFKFVKSTLLNDLLMNHLVQTDRYVNNCIDVSVASIQIFKPFFSNDEIINKYKNDKFNWLNNVKIIYQSQSYWIYKVVWWHENITLDNKDLLYTDIISKDSDLSKEQVIKLFKDYQYKEKEEEKERKKTTKITICIKWCQKNGRLLSILCNHREMNAS